MKCDMCGSSGTLFKTVIEDAELNVCRECTRFGKVIHEIRPEPNYKVQQKPVVEEVTYIVSDDYAAQIKKKRESLGLTQEEFAHKINIKTSRIHQLESGHMKPTANLASKLKKAYGLDLIQQYKEKHEELEHTEDASFTLADFVKKKKKAKS